jgi:hypothetical protein
MKQRAIQAGVVHFPVYQFIDAGQEFDHPELLKWAIPIGSLEPGADAVVVDEDAPTEQIATPKKKPKAAPVEPPAEDLI